MSDRAGGFGLRLAPTSVVTDAVPLDSGDEDDTDPPESPTPAPTSPRPALKRIK